MLIEEVTENVTKLVEKLNFAEKVTRSLDMIDRAYKEFGDGLVVANSLGKDSVAVWHLAKRVSPKIRGFIVTTRFKPPETKQFMAEEVSRYPELRVSEMMKKFLTSSMPPIRIAAARFSRSSQPARPLKR
jgi:3'-phosphoadenosine 5'-phosphosulfate sulfotransferase (PAPS reductase)/FAD synthetase